MEETFTEVINTLSSKLECHADLLLPPAKEGAEGKRLSRGTEL